MARLRSTLLAIVSDIHANSTIGLCPSEGVRLDDGGRYTPSKPQQWTWDSWCDFWTCTEAERRRRKADLYVILNGDLVDGIKARNTQLITRNEEGQAYIVQRVLSEVRRLKPTKSFVIRGTEYHVGPSASSDESVARWLGAEKDPITETYSHWRLALKIHDTLFDFQHHPGTRGTRRWTMGAGIARLAFMVWLEHQRRNWPAPDFAIRSHFHEFMDSGNVEPTRAIITPAWQLKTAHVHKVVPEAIADIGGLLIAVEPGNRCEVMPKLYEPARPPVWTA